MNKQLENLRYQLIEVSEAEATKLYRLAWRMVAHNCDPSHIQKCRDEARELHMNAYPERLLDPYRRWSYAFKF